MAEPILVVGYPKSGNTWLTRLVAELIDAPVAGFYEEPWNDEVSIEGQERESPYAVYKGHQRIQVLKDIPLRQIVYVVRDVRDVVISGAHYWYIPPQNYTLRRLARNGRVRKVFKIFGLGRKSFKIKGMIRTVSCGNRYVPWCHVPWDVHVHMYRQRGAFIVRYEDMLGQPEVECRRILEWLGLEATEEHIKRTIENQSFKKAKDRFVKAGDEGRASFMRSGKCQQWKDDLTPNQQVHILKRFAETLQELGYVDD